MAKNIKLVQAEARIVELETELAQLKQATSTTKWLKAALVFIRKEFVKTLNKEQFATQAGQLVIEALKHIEEKSPSVKCEKCNGHGLVDVRGDLLVCYDCVFGRALGHPGKQHVVDVVVSGMHREEQQNRFSKQRPSNWDVSEEERKAAAQAEKPQSTTDIPL